MRLALQIATLLLVAGAFYSSTKAADDVVCKAEIHRVRAACKKGKKTERCRAAIADLNLCLAEVGSDDPIGGV